MRDTQQLLFQISFKGCAQQCRRSTMQTLEFVQLCRQKYFIILSHQKGSPKLAPLIRTVL